MPTGGNEIKFKWDPSMSQDSGPQTIERPETVEPQQPPKVAESAAPSTKEEAPAPPVQQTKKPQEAKEKKPESDRPKDEKPAPPEESRSQSLTDEQVLSYWNTKKGTNYKTLDDFVQTKEIEKIVEKEKALPEHLKGYMKYYDETGRSLEDFANLNRDFGKMGNMQLARDAVRKENVGLELSDSDTDILLAEKMNVDPDDLSTLDGRDLIKLKSFANKHLQSLVEEQKKYNNPLESKEKQAENEPSRPVGETVTLTNGQTISKDVYDKQRKIYNEARTQAVNSLDGFQVELVVDNNGEKVNVPFKYDYSEDDRHSMLSYTEDVNAILPSYSTADGSFDHRSFNEDQWWAKPANREKAINALLKNARSMGVDEVMKDKRNINFDQKQKPRQEQKLPEGYVNGRLDEVRNAGGYGVKFGLPTN